MFDRIQDTIVAISSPPGVGQRGIIRMSGPQAIEIAGAVFRYDSDGNSSDQHCPHDNNCLHEVRGHQRRFGTLLLGANTARLTDTVRLIAAQASTVTPVTMDANTLADAPSFRVPAEIYVFRAPASYTRQDLVELHVVGSPPILAMIFDSLVACGARPAEPGEFTGRAFLLGAMDLTRVEGVAAIIHAQSDAQLRASEVLLHGTLGRQMRTMRDELADMLALIEAQIDFADEPIEFVAPQQVTQTIEQTMLRIDELLAHSGSAERLDVLPRLVLVGLPNAGKSSLFNRLTGLDRTIISAMAGTTRDVVTAPLKLANGEVLLCDTAGIASLNPASSIADMANVYDKTAAWPLDIAQQLDADIQQATLQAMASADAILLIVDADDRPHIAIDLLAPLLKGRRSAVVFNKIDRLCDHDRRNDRSNHQCDESCNDHSCDASYSTSCDAPMVKNQDSSMIEGQDASIIGNLPVLGRVSTLIGLGIDELRLALADFCWGHTDVLSVAEPAPSVASTVIPPVAPRIISPTANRGIALLALSNRQRDALHQASQALHHARVLCNESSVFHTHSELIAMEIRHAIHALSVLLGDVTNEEILGRIFARFCIGK